jgi:hypothetical protein
VTPAEREALRRKLLEVVLRHGRRKSHAMRMDMAETCAEFMGLSSEEAETLRNLLSLETEVLPYLSLVPTEED